MREYLEQQGLAQISDEGALEAIVDEVLTSNPKQLQQYCSGKTKLQGFFVGCAEPVMHTVVKSWAALLLPDLRCAACRQVMKASKGMANPGLLNAVLMRKLEAAQKAAAS